MNELLSIEVIYVTPSVMEKIALQVQPDCTLQQAVQLSGLISKYDLHLSPIVEVKEILGDFVEVPSNIEPESNSPLIGSQTTDLHPFYKIGVYGTLKDAKERVNAGDRVEILRPLTIEPKAARFHRVKLKQKQEQKWGRV